MKIIKYLSTSMIITLLSISIILAQNERTQKEQENKSTSNCCEKSKTQTSINNNCDKSSSSTKETKNQHTQLHQKKDQSEASDCCLRKNVDNIIKQNKDSDKNIPQKECCNMKSEKEFFESEKNKNSKN